MHALLSNSAAAASAGGDEEKTPDSSSSPPFQLPLLPLVTSRSERDELRQLSEALRYFVSSVEAARVKASAASSTIDAPSSNPLSQMLAVAKEEQAVFDLFYAELARQVAQQCRERGELLHQLRVYYAALFRRLPALAEQTVSALQSQQALTTRLGDELQAMRSEHMQMRVGALSSCIPRFVCR